MSLEIYAKHLAEKGRGPDDTLVHMSRDEVKGLNDLAMAHGGQLTINPETGLPEAGFLSSLIPMIAGAALAPATGGASLGLTSAWQTAALVGAGSYLMNPKAGLMGGLKAGLGAYGGAGLGDALAAQGMEQATAAKLAENQAYEGLKGQASSLGKMSLVDSPYAQFSEMPMISPTDYATQANNIGSQMQTLRDAAAAKVAPTDFLGGIKMAGQGAQSAFLPTSMGGTTGGLSGLYDKMGGGMGTISKVGAALAPAATLQKDMSVAPVADKDMGQRYSYSPGVAKPLPTPDVPSYNAMLTQQDNFGAQQNYYPNQSYTPISNDAAKDLYHYAGGGPVEQMSNNNAIGANTGFPQAYLHNNAYATPYQTPISQNVLTGAGDVSVDPYTGEQRMASGGKAADKPENRDVDIYNDTGGPTGGIAPGPNSGTPADFAQNVQNFNDVANAISSMGLMGMLSSAINSPSASSISDAAPGMGGMGGGVGGGGDVAGAGSTGMGSDVGGESSAPSDGGAPSGGSSSDGGEARGGLSPLFTHHMATGGISDAHYNLGGYSDGGRLLRGPGDGVSDSIPAMIGKKQPARLADGEFVVPARIVSELGNGSTEAGARKLYAMMDRVQSARRHTVGKGKVAKNSRADKYLPA